MTFFKAATMSAPLLEVPAALWAELMAHLRVQGGGVRESGAFLLGHKTDAGRVVLRFVPYEQLQPDALRNDYVSLKAASFAKLWEVCRAEGMTVVADVHTHPFGPGQSRSDRANPMVALKEHIALIVPRFAKGNPRPRDLGLYVYEGNHQWASYSGSDVDHLLRLTNAGVYQ
ncbi:Mov34/MPN/PAD-1 family protein [Variovorax ginsengisoli]|uniref:Mov34/MPN/PAD-1 family protein n=1 Tax=Variovorax ginsengisoli TaxID=363844 RepID=A0ABT8SDZ6_9BURK|nr:Mov34/MPN/PAD-1 family protein [Variovorax ginsengisoli]MDN8617975.1 Mov34/MPN/PAD-1 family protein [Variovorax ginsengisoli]MDO1537145.1 Mov34/MPN/PAD-1 family protein [Variovorax ginsengisoli]